MNRLARALAAAVVAAVPFVPASPAAAATVQLSPSGTLAEQPVITGTLPVENATSASVTVTPAGGGDGVTVGGCGTAGISCTDQGVTLNVPVALARNGPYTVTATASRPPRAVLPGESAQGEGSFALRIPPVAPARLVAEPNGAERTVRLSWAQNPEPDLVGYDLYRGVDGAEPTRRNDTPIPAGGANTVTVVDEVGEGGRMTYYVVAVRRGATAGDTVTGPRSATATATVDRIAPTTTSPPTSAGSGGTGSGAASGAGAASAGTPSSGGLRPQASAEPVRITSTGKVDLSGYTPAPLQVGPAPAPGDPGYQETLPYRQGASAAQPAAEPDAGDEAALPVGSLTSDESNRRALLSFLAGAMVLFMLSMHLRWLLRRATPVA